MKEQAIRPEKITKPIQLLGAWLAGLFSIDSCFLVAAANMGTGTWEAEALVVAAIFNVPLFLLAVFLLQTKFRPELQEDSYYSSYLSNKTNKILNIKKEEIGLIEIVKKIEEMKDLLANNNQNKEEDGYNITDLIFGINKHLKDKDEIKSKLSDKGIMHCKSFGSSDPPPHRNISISRYLPNNVIKEILLLAKELGFKSYNLFDNIEEEADEHVLIGSYGEADFELT